MLLRFYQQLADALEARNPITEEFFIRELRAFLAQSQYMIFYRYFISYTNAPLEHASGVVETTLDELMRMLDKDKETRRLSLTCLRELPPHGEFLSQNLISVSQCLLETWREKIDLEKILPRLKDDDVQQQRLAILTIEQSTRLGRLPPTLLLCTLILRCYRDLLA